MSWKRTLGNTIFVLVVIGTGIAAFILPAPARAQYGYQCPPGYYYDPNYGCVPSGYYYGPPYYVYPDYGFDFFYGQGWGRRWNGYPPPRGGVSHGGGTTPHGGGIAPRGGGGIGGHRGH